ncbi:MFS transporter [Chondromyces apiculatus]|uniref:Major facilitator superfamily MFS_1 n=1 Tax=Chondromyces apiculatus DSM 436 TaxID=1192034 RepID=A0A017TEY5_9BACT|nr:MFS transporter [Chondromyces apiculatus]EYF07385.1 major facilitator superfamily MFS_1 [Chondromyces apiculatus DSM 436]
MIRAGIQAARELGGLTRELPDLRVIAGAGMLGAVGAGLLNPVLSLHLASRGLDVGRIGLMFTLGSLLPVVLQPALGALSDRMGRRGILLGVYLSTSLLVPALALLTDPLPLAAALCARLMLDRSVAPLRAAAVADSAPPARRAMVFGWLASFTNLVLVGAMVGSSLTVAWVGTRGTLAVAGAFFFASSLAWLGLRGGGPAALAREPGAVAPGAARGEREGREQRERRGKRGLAQIAASLAAPLRDARRDPVLAALVVYQFCFVFALDAFPIYLPLFAVHLGVPQAWVGPLIASSWLVFALVQPVGGRLADRGRDRTPWILGGLTGMAVCAALLGVAGWIAAPYALPLLAVAWIAMAIPDGLSRPAVEARVVDQAPPAERGRFLGVLGAAAALANVLAPVSYGALARRAGPHATFLLSAVALCAALLAMDRVRARARTADPSLTSLTRDS